MTRRGIISFSLSGSASTLTFSALLNGMDSNTRIRVSQFTVLLPVSFPPARFSDWHVAPLWRGVNRITPTIKSDFTVQGEGIFLGVIPEEADKHKKSESTKMNNQTNKQPNEKNICSSFNDELLLELTVPLVAPGATAFLMLFVFPFSLSFSSNYSSSSEPHKHGSVAPGSPSEGRTYSLAMYKKSKLNQKCCSWCLSIL